MKTDDFLCHLKDTKSPVTIFLVNGIKLQGCITGFCPSSIFLERDGHTQLIYQHAISTIMPNQKVLLDNVEKPSS